MNSIVKSLMRMSQDVMGSSAFFTPEEMALPKIARQGQTDPDALFDKAEVAWKHMLDWLDRGKGVDRQLSLSRINLEPKRISDVLDDMDEFGSVLVVPPMKDRERAAEKVEADYHGDWSRLVDIVRATIAVRQYKELAPVVDELRESGMVLARRPEDSFARPSLCGMRRLKMNVVYPGGHIGEVQVHLKDMFKVSLLTHKMYKTVRDIIAKVKAEGRHRMKDDELVAVVEMSRFVRDQFYEAWRRCSGAMSASVQEPFLHTVYCEYRGLPAVVEEGCFPVLKVDGKDVVVYDLMRFICKARPIIKDEFDAMVETK